MKSKYSLAFIQLLFCGLSYSQPVLTGATINPVVGDMFYTVSSIYPGSEGSAGANINWNFSSLFSGIIDTSEVIAVSATPYAATFPSASFSIHPVSSSTYDFFKASSDSLVILGTQNTTGTTIYTNPFKISKYPYAFNTGYTENFYATITGTSPGTESGTLVSLADGYEDLQLPYGTLNNVLRVKMVLTFYETTSASTDTITETIYQWYLPGVHQAVLYMGSATASSLTYNFCSYLNEASLGINDLNAGTDFSNLFPNPSGEFSTLTYSLSNNTPVKIAILNSLGEVVYSTNEETMSPGFYSEELDVRGLKKGIYFLNIQTAKAIETKKLIVE